MVERYRTVTDPGKASFSVRGSQFLGQISGAVSVAEADSIIDHVRTEHPDATHVVAAYRLRTDPFREWATDDGEPRGSAGPPVLQVLTGESLENVVATIVRYYGGTNLGIGGLARAYSDATKEAIANADIEEREPQQYFSIETTYDDSGRVRGVLESTAASFDATYEAHVTFRGSVPTSTYPELYEQLMDTTSGRVCIETEE